jgi:hypothetical protein
MAKAQLKTQPTTASVAKFIDQIAAEATRKDCRVLLKLMKEATKARPVMWGDAIVGFGNWTYKTRSGYSGDWFTMGFSPRKQALTLYLLPNLDVCAKELSKLGKHKTGKCCLYIKRLADVDLNILKRMLAKSVKQTKKLQSASNVCGTTKSP